MVTKKANKYRGLESFSFETNSNKCLSSWERSNVRRQSDTFLRLHKNSMISSWLKERAKRWTNRWTMADDDLWLDCVPQHFAPIQQHPMSAIPALHRSYSANRTRNVSADHPPTYHIHHRTHHGHAPSRWKWNNSRGAWASDSKTQGKS